MTPQKAPVTNIDAYIAGFPQDTQKLIAQVRATIIKAAPEAEEIISYQMPAYKYPGALVYFAAYKNHIGFYPTGSGIEAFREELSGFKGAKGSVRFPLDKPLPLKLIAEIVAFRVKVNLERAAIKAKNGKAESL